MQPIVAVIAPGMMGSAVGQRLVENGIEVRTAARRPQRGHRGARQGRRHGRRVGRTDRRHRDIILSILPPGDALGPGGAAGARAARRGEEADLSSIATRSIRHGAAHRARGEETGATFVDGGIIGGPPKAGYSPKIYLSGEAAPRVAELTKYGLEMPIQPGPIGAASAMKMSYAGITKGFTALGAAMMLAAIARGHGRGPEGGTVGQPAGAVRLADAADARTCTRRPIAGSPRWRRSPSSSARTPPRGKFYEGAARLYERIAADFDGDRKEIAALDAFCKPKS